MKHWAKHFAPRCHFMCPLCSGLSQQHKILQSITHFIAHLKPTYYWLLINLVPWPPCCAMTLSAVYADHLVTSDGHAEVHRWRVQRGLTGRKETLLFPGGQTLHVLLSNHQLPWESKRRQRGTPAQSEPSFIDRLTPALFLSVAFPV